MVTAADVHQTSIAILLHSWSPPLRQISLVALGVLDYHMEDLLRREDFIISTRFARMDPTECFFVFRLDHRRRGMIERWQCESTCF